MNFAMATLGLKEIGKFLWEGREKRLPSWLSQFSFLLRYLLVMNLRSRLQKQFVYYKKSLMFYDNEFSSKIKNTHSAVH